MDGAGARGVDKSVAKGIFDLMEKFAATVQSVSLRSLCAGLLPHRLAEGPLSSALYGRRVVG